MLLLKASLEKPVMTYNQENCDNGKNESMDAISPRRRLDSEFSKLNSREPLANDTRRAKTGLY